MVGYNFRSVGGSFADELTKIAAEREAQKRQAMLDAITQQRERRLETSAAAEAKYNEENLKSLMEQREANRALNATNLRAKEIENAGKTFRIGQRLDPEQAKHLQGIGLSKHEFKASELGEQPETGEEVFTGTQEQQQLAAALEDPEIPEEAKAALRSGVKPTAELFKKAPPKFHSAGRYIFREQPDGSLVKAAEGPEPQSSTTIRMGSGMTPGSEANIVLSMQRQWDRTRQTEKEMNRQMTIMEEGLKRFDADPVGGSEAVRVTFEKILDPISVVREGEYARQGIGLSLLQRLDGLVQKYGSGGGQIPKPALEEMVKTARAFTEGLKQFNAGEKERIGRTADRYTIPRDLIFADISQAPANDAPPANPNPGANPGGVTETPEQRRARIIREATSGAGRPGAK